MIFKILENISINLFFQTISKLYPFSKPISSGINDELAYCEFDNCNISDKDFRKIEKAFLKLSNAAYNLSLENKNPDSIKRIKETYSELALNDVLRNENFLKINDFYIPIDKDISENEIKNIKSNLVKGIYVFSVGGSYWKNNCKNKQLIRIYFSCKRTQKEMDDFVLEFNEKQNNDHRKIGKDLKMFTFDMLSGKGLPIWLNNGYIVKSQVRKLLNEIEFQHDFKLVSTPILGNVELYKTSGHWSHYQENMFPILDFGDEELVLRPMTCPHHVLIYKNEIQSYRDLPIRLAEESMLHRYESSGSLTGFERVREMTLEDAHIFCSEDQIKDEVLNCYQMIIKAHKNFDTKILQVDLALHNPDNKEKFHNDNELWIKSENLLRKLLKENNIDFVEKVGDAAFYGPKIDFQVKTNLNRIVTMSTIQLDFLLPKKFDLEFKDHDSKMKTPIMIHLSTIGTYERLLSILLEQSKGALKTWLSPRQVVIIPVNKNNEEYANMIHNKLKMNFIRSEVDLRNERISKKIREGQISKTPYLLILGDNEQNEQTISYREYGQENTNILKINDFLEKIEKIIRLRE